MLQQDLLSIIFKKKIMPVAELEPFYHPEEISALDDQRWRDSAKEQGMHMVPYIIKNCARYFARIVFIILIGIMNSFALDPAKTINQYGHDLWLRQNGLPANGVNRILQTRDGYLWLGTTAGLFRFDGVHFDGISTDLTDSKNLETVSALYQSSDSSLWIGTANNGLRRYKNGKVYLFGPDEQFFERQIHAIIESRAGNIWVGTSYGLFTFRGGKFTSIPIEPNYITGIAEGLNARIWIGTHDGVRVFDDETRAQVNSLTTENGLPNNVTTSMLSDDEGIVWIGTGNGLARWKDGSITIYTGTQGLPNNHISAMCKDRDGNLWVGTFNGIGRLSGSNWTTYTIADGLSHNQPLSIAEDREGSIWIGTLEGLNRFKDVNITPYTTKEGLSNDYISGLAETHDGSFYFLSNANNTLTRLKDGKYTILSMPIGPACAARDGSLWVAHTGVLTNIHKDRIKQYGSSAGIPNKWISAITEDDQSLLVYVDRIGVCRFVKGRLQPYLLKDGQAYSSTEYVMCLYSSPEGVLWIGTTHGLVRIMNGESKLFGLADGLADERINSIHDDQRGSLWIGTPRGGLTRYTNGKFINYSTKTGLLSNEVQCILSDQQGDIWWSSTRGIGYVSRRDLDDFEAGQITAVGARLFTTADGMKTDQCFDEWQPAGLKGSDGRLWFATVKGAIAIDPKAFKRNQLIPTVIIDRVVANQEIMLPDRFMKFSSDKNKFEFHYSALSLLVPQRVLFKYMLEGYDNEWVEPGTRRIAYYTNLPPGNYRFRVIACNNDGLWNNIGASVDFYLVPHFYRTYWFYGLSICVILLTILGAYRLRVNSLRANERQLENIVQLRTKELQEQRSFLRKIVDLNPSYIFAKDKEGRFTLANLALAQAYGMEAEDLVGKIEADLNPRKDEVEKFWKDDLEVIESGTDKFIPDEEFTDKDGKQHWMQIIRKPIISEDGSSHQMLGVATDITERKQAEEQLKASLTEKEVLLKEIHHRVKNNMQIVSSLLNLQSNQMKNEESKQALAECKQRVRSMALVHENLYRSKNLAGINFCEYLECMTNELVRSFGNRRVMTTFEMESIFLPIDVAIPCGLIVNELVTNALKYAFPSDGEGKISVSLRKKEDKLVELCLQDNGVGFPHEGDLRSLKSMGITLVLSLTEQIDGEISLIRKPGTKFCITFPMKTK
jgi:PAS domain S-box-containing protein